MTLILENVKQEFLDDFKALADKAQAHLVAMRISSHSEVF